MKNMATQMELFEPVERGFDEGGLMDEGGTVDPVSGNDVPPGSTQEEVRDDVPAQLSEGEFVFPADVVRYIGLEKLMRMRQEAKMGLAAMEAMGQMGNSEEAVMPDDLPFDMYDLDIEEEDEYNMASGGVVKMQQGGTTYTPPTIGGFTPPPPVTTGFSGPQPAQPFQSGQGQFQVAGAAEGAVTPKTSIQGVTPTFSDFVGMNVPGVDFKMVTFYNENGQAKVLKQFPDGSYEDPANPGVKVSPTDMGLTQEIKTEVTPTEQRVQTAQVRDTGGDRDDDTTTPAGASIALGGTVDESTRTGGGIPGTRYSGPSAVVSNATTYNVSFTGIPGGIFNKKFIADMVTKNDAMPPGSRATVSSVTNPNAKVSLPGFKYNEIRTNPRGSLAKSVQAAIDAVGNMKSDKNTFSYEDGKLSYENEDGETVSVDDETLGIIGESMYNDIVDDTKSGFFSKGDTFADVGKGLTDDEKTTLSAFNDQEFSDFESKGGLDDAGGPTFSDDAEDADDSDAGQPSGNDAGDDETSGGGPEGGEGQPGGMGVVCLTEDMKVKLNGVIDFVTNVKVGDIIDSTIVTEVLHKHMREGYYVVNGELNITNDHPILANGSWKRTEDLVLGDYINNVEVTSLEYVEQVTPTVYIGTENDRYDVYTEGEVYTVHGQYKNSLKKAA